AGAADSAPRLLGRAPAGRPPPPPRRGWGGEKPPPSPLWGGGTPPPPRGTPVWARLEPRRTRRLRIRPPEILCCGHKPNQLQKCFSDGQRLMSVPISLKSTNAVVSSIPSIAVKSTPHTRYSRARPSKRGSLASRLPRRGR